MSHVSPTSIAALNWPFKERSEPGVGRVGPDGHFVAVTNGLCRLLGYSRRELLTKTLSEITHVVDRAKETDLAEEILSGKQTSYDMHKRCVRRDGSVLFVNQTCAAVRAISGEIVQYIVLVSVSSAQEVQTTFQMALVALYGCVLIVSAKGLISTANFSAGRMFGYKRQHLIGRAVEDILPGLDVAAGTIPRGAQLAYGRRSDGSTFLATLRISPLGDTRNPVVLVSITERRELRQSQLQTLEPHQRSLMRMVAPKLKRTHQAERDLRI